LVEVQTGSYLEEDGIVRLGDVYRRARRGPWDRASRYSTGCGAPTALSRAPISRAVSDARAQRSGSGSRRCAVPGTRSAAPRPPATSWGAPSRTGSDPPSWRRTCVEDGVAWNG